MNKKRIAIFIHHPHCSIQSAHGIYRALTDHFSVDFISQYDLKKRKLDKYDMISIPGGIGDADTWHYTLEPFEDKIINQIHKGKFYLGICMGAYWAGPHYFDILDRVEPVQYIKRSDAELKRSFGSVVELNWKKQKDWFYFYDGCSFVKKGGKFKTIAKYKNGDAAAIIQNNIGLIGPHLESDIYWYSKPYMKPYWHEYRHHLLLLDFVKKMMK